MKVLMVSKACVTRLYREKLAQMAAMGAELTLVVPPAWGDLAYEPPAPGETEPFTTVIRPIAQNGKNHWHWYRGGLADLTRKTRPDLVHIDEEHYSYVTRQVLQEARRSRIPALFFTWQNIYKRYPWPFSAIEEDVFRHTVGAIAGNQEALEVLRRKGYTKPVTVIPQFGTDPTTFSPGPSPLTEELGLKGQVAIGYVGRLIKDKGLDTLLQAAERLFPDYPRLRLVLLGSGPWKAEAEPRIKAQGLGDRVLFAPWMPSSRMPDVMRALDVFVLPSLTTPSWKEQFGRVLTEAMASGVPVVGSSSGEIPHVIGDAGFVFPEGDPKALATMLRPLLDREDLRLSAGEKGRARVLERFTQEAVARNTLQFYRDLLSSTS